MTLDLAQNQPLQNHPKIVFYFVRHGQTDWNLQGKIQGQTDVPLNDKGRAQGDELKEKLAGLTFTDCYSSDLQRASETAHIILKDRPTKVVVDQRLRERNFRELEGKFNTAYIHATSQDLKNVESDKALSERIFLFLNEVIHTHPNSQILIVTHGGVIRSILSKVLLLSCRDVAIKIGNMAMIKLLFANGLWSIEEISDIRWTL